MRCGKRREGKDQGNQGGDKARHDGEGNLQMCPVTFVQSGHLLINNSGIGELLVGIVDWMSEISCLSSLVSYNQAGSSRCNQHNGLGGIESPGRRLLLPLCN